LFEGGLSGDLLFLDISNIDGFTAGLDVTGALVSHPIFLIIFF